MSYTHHERLYNACIWLKKIQFAENFLKMPKIHLGYFQRQSSRGFLLKRCSWEFRKIHKESPVLESLLNNVAVLHLTTYLKKRLQQHRRFSMNFAEFLRTSPGGCSVFHYFKRGFSISAHHSFRDKRKTMFFFQNCSGEDVA